MSTIKIKLKQSRLDTNKVIDQLTKRTWRLYHGDMLDVLRQQQHDNKPLYDVCICDPPYHLQSIVKRFSKTKLTDKNKTGRRSAARVDSYARLARGFMNTVWDGGKVSFNPKTWRRVYKRLKPGAYLIVFGGTRTSHRIACAIEDAGFDIRDTIMWMHGQGFPKSRNISRDLDKLKGRKRKTDGTQRAPGYAKLHVIHGVQKEKGQHPKISDKPLSKIAKEWYGYGTALKPGFEPIIVAQKPIEGSIARNVLQYGTGGMNIDLSRIRINSTKDDPRLGGKGTWLTDKMAKRVYVGGFAGKPIKSSELGRWPANVIHDGSPEVLQIFGLFGNKKGFSGGGRRKGLEAKAGVITPLASVHGGESGKPYSDDGSVARFFYTAKANKSERVFHCTICDKTFRHLKQKKHQHGRKKNGKPDFSHITSHPTVKPIKLMRYLVQLFTPPKGRVLDCFAGSGTTLQAAMELGFRVTGIEQDKHYIKHIKHRLREAGLAAHYQQQKVA